MIVKCENCGIEYELNLVEDPNNFQCECGGKLSYKKNEEFIGKDNSII